MSGQIIRPHRSMRSPDAKEAALQAVLRGGLNKVLWDDCRLIWDSRSIIDDGLVSDDQVSGLLVILSDTQDSTAKS